MRLLKKRRELGYVGCLVLKQHLSVHGLQLVNERTHHRVKLYIDVLDLIDCLDILLILLPTLLLWYLTCQALWNLGVEHSILLHEHLLILSHELRRTVNWRLYPEGVAILYELIRSLCLCLLCALNLEVLLWRYQQLLDWQEVVLHEERMDHLGQELRLRLYVEVRALHMLLVKIKYLINAPLWVNLLT